MFSGVWADRQHRVFLFIFLFAAVVRLWSINNPLIDQHAWRQSSSGIVARNYLSDMNPFHPRVDMIDPGYPSAFSFYEYYVALLAKVFGFSNRLGRLVTLSFFLVGFVCFYRLASRLFGGKAALWGSAFYAFLPTSAYYSRSFQSDAGMMSCTVIFMYYFTRWVEEDRWSDCLLATAAAFFMFSLKIPSLFMLLPAVFYLHQYRRWSFLRDPRCYAMLAVALALPLFYHFYVPVASHGFYRSAFFAQDKWGNAAIWGSFEFWFKTFLPLGNLWEYQYMHTGYILFILGIFKPVTDRRQRVAYAWMGAVALFFIVSAYGMHHEYYSLPLLPVACLFIGRFLGAFFDARPWAVERRRWQAGLVSFMVLYAFVFSMIRYHDLCDLSTNTQYIPMAKVIQEHTSPGELVIYSTRGYEELQYLAHRRGVHLRAPLLKGRAVATKEAGGDLLAALVPVQAPYRIFAVADYDLAKEEPEMYNYLKRTCTLIYERQKEYIFLLRGPGGSPRGAVLTAHGGNRD